MCYIAYAKRSLIAVLGPVGVGKSSTIRLLASALSNMGIEIHTEFVKAYHGLSYMLWKSIAKLLKLPKEYAPWYSVIILGYKRLAKILTLISLYIDLLISIPIKLSLIKLFKTLGCIILSEEYLYSTLLDYLYSLITLGFKSKFYITFPVLALYSLVSRYKPDIVIVLDADTRVLSERWKFRGYGDPQLEYVLLQKLFFKRFVQASIMLDTSNMCLRDTVLSILKVLIRTFVKETSKSV